MDNRNIYGFVFFTLIVISTVFINYIFFQPAAVQVEPPKSYTRTECFTKSKRVAETSARPRVEQAVLDLKTNTFDLEVNLTKPYEFENEGIPVTLRFYTFDSQPLELATETIVIQPNSANRWHHWDVNGKSSTTLKINKVFNRSWTRNLRSTQSLYVVPQVGFSVREAVPRSFEFNINNATPVLLVARK